MTSQTVRDIIEQTIQRLRKHKPRRFGRRPCSYYGFLTGQKGKQGHEVFVTYVQVHTPGSAVCGASPDLTQAQKSRLNEIVDWVDQCGQWVADWKRATAFRRPAGANWKNSSNCGQSGACPVMFGCRSTPARIAADLVGVLQTHIGDYTFEQAFFVWAMPLLNARLIALIEPAVQAARPAICVTLLREQLVSAVSATLDWLGQSCGIYGISLEDMAERALLAVLRAEDEKYRKIRSNQDLGAGPRARPDQAAGPPALGAQRGTKVGAGCGDRPVRDTEKARAAGCVCLLCQLDTGRARVRRDNERASHA